MTRRRMSSWMRETVAYQFKHGRYAMNLLDGYTYRNRTGAEVWIVGDTRGHNDGSVWSVQGNHYDRASGRIYSVDQDGVRWLMPAEFPGTLVQRVGRTDG